MMWALRLCCLLICGLGSECMVDVGVKAVVGIRCVTGGKTCDFAISVYFRVDCYGMHPRRRRHMREPCSPENGLTVNRKNAE